MPRLAPSGDFAGEGDLDFAGEGDLDLVGDLVRDRDRDCERVRDRERDGVLDRECNREVDRAILGILYPPQEIVWPVELETEIKAGVTY